MRVRISRRLAAAGFGAAVLAVAALTPVVPPAVYLPLMGLALAAEAAALVLLVRRRMRDYGVGHPLDLVSRRRRAAAQRTARGLDHIGKWRERLDAGFTAESVEALEAFADDADRSREVRRAANAALDMHRSRPAPVRPSGEDRFDVVIASNFNLPGGTTASNVNEIALLAEAGLRVGLVHNPLFDMHPGRPINKKVREVLDGDAVRIVGPGAKVSCDLLMVRFPPAASRLRDDLPEVRAEQRMLVVNQAPMTYYEGGIGRKRVWDVETVHRNLQEWIGEHRWVTVGPLAHQALLDHHSDELDGVDLAAEHWHPSIDVERVTPRGDHPVGDVVRVGRHSRDHLSKWPELASQLRACYPDRPDFAIRVLGGTDVPRQILGRLPSNWAGHAFDEIAVGDFLRELDVYAYYTCSSWLEAFGRAPVEAMAAGVPVVLPPVFEPTFGPGALYAEPEEAATLIAELAGDHGAYLEQRGLGLATVRERFSHEAHRERFRSLGLKL